MFVSRITQISPKLGQSHGLSAEYTPITFGADPEKERYPGFFLTFFNIMRHGVFFACIHACMYHIYEEVQKGTFGHWPIGTTEYHSSFTCLNQLFPCFNF